MSKFVETKIVDKPMTECEWAWSVIREMDSDEFDSFCREVNKEWKGRYGKPLFVKKGDNHEKG